MDANQQMALALSAGLGSVAKPPVAFPSNDDMLFARKNDAAYGNPSAGFLAGQGVIPKVNIVDVARLYNADKDIREGESPALKVAPNTADNLYKGWLATRNSAVAGLGFDPHRMMTSPPSNARLGANGMYFPGSDTIWYDDQNSPHSVVHESMHRGIQKLREADAFPSSAKGMPEELLVRALMQRHFGDLEKNKGSDLDQITASKQYINDPATYDIEDAAANLYAKRKPGGPR